MGKKVRRKTLGKRREEVTGFDDGSEKHKRAMRRLLKVRDHEGNR